ncbi:MAG: UvrD-helicase domain-containing protein, partial [Duncaniella sp.]|nr:UvrD-helicase domain-containing protein [Duncaniella sp.]
MNQEEYLGKLNQQQRAAVEYCDGPQLVIAGAGSGKTRVLTYKIVHLLAQGYEPWRILALTFTNKAAREMRERIEQLVGPDTASRLWMGTFHSIFARILRQNAERIGFKSSFTIYDASDSKALVKLIIKDLGLDDKVYKPSTVHNAISWAKNALISPEQYAVNRELLAADERSKRPRTCEIYRIYRDRCAVADAMDFDDLLYYTNVLLRDNDDVCRHYQEYFRYVLVDEYQDTNFAQHMIVSQITRGTQRLCVVGDDAQSIYSFRGANIRNILGLTQAYPGLQTFKL